MIYCIYQKDDKSYEKVIKILNSEDDFLSAVKESIKSLYNNNLQLLENKLTNQVKLDNSVKEGYYLLINKTMTKKVKI